jgi:tetratricopeptide (TPR) repeat protein
MAFWKKIFGKDFEEAVADAEELLRHERYGEARLAFEQALGRAKNAPAERSDHVRQQIAHCKDALAQDHLRDGRAFAEQGNVERALECYQTAADVAADQELVQEASRLQDELDAQDARAAFDEQEELTDDERYQVLSGAWEEPRADELDSYGDAFRDAFLLLHNDQAEQAAQAMAALLDEHPDALYLRLEFGLAQRHAGRAEQSAATIKEFLADLAEEEDDLPESDGEEGQTPQVSQSRLQAHARLAEIYLELERPDEAEEELRTLVDLLPEQSEPYVHLGHLLREQNRLDEALEVLLIGQRHMGQLRPDMRVVREIGLTYLAMGDKEQALDTLKSVVAFDAGQGNFNFDPITAVPLAELYEETGQLDRAADLYRHLAAGTHSAGHFAYNREAGRLLAAMDQPDLARRYLARAQELAPSPELREKIDESISRIS